jgi:hypothetical protein
MLMIVGACDDTPSLQDRSCTIGIVGPDLVARWGAGGHVGRASDAASMPSRSICTSAAAAAPDRAVAGLDRAARSGDAEGTGAGLRLLARGGYA